MNIKSLKVSTVGGNNAKWEYHAANKGVNAFSYWGDMFFLPIKLALLLKNILACLHKEMYKEQLKNHHNKKDCI